MSKNRKVYKRLSNVMPLEVSWLWPGLIPDGMLTIIEGDPGVSKSYLTMDLTARITAGRNLPDETKLEPGKVIILSAEDDPAYTIRPRIDAMGGDPERVLFQNVYSSMDDEGLKRLSKAAGNFRPRLIVIDPLFAYVPSDLSAYSPNHIRPLLAKLSEIASKVNAAMIIVRHLTKAKRDKAIYQGTGSIDVIAAVRSSLLVANHPDDEHTKVLAHVKHNLSPRQDSWMYELTDPKGNGDLPKIKWLGRCELAVEDLLSADTSGPSALSEAVDFLNKELEGGAVKATVIEGSAEAKGHSKRTLDRAKKQIGVKSKKRKGQWYWSLPTPGT